MSTNDDLIRTTRSILREANGIGIVRGHRARLEALCNALEATDDAFGHVVRALDVANESVKRLTDELNALKSNTEETSDGTAAESTDCRDPESVGPAEVPDHQTGASPVNQ